VKYRVKGTGAKLIAVPSELFYEPKAVNRPRRGMVENMKADQTAVEVLIRFVLFHADSSWDFVIEIRYISTKIFCQQSAEKNVGKKGLRGEGLIAVLKEQPSERRARTSWLLQAVERRRILYRATDRR
jgi:hypothetical protein